MAIKKKQKKVVMRKFPKEIEYLRKLIKLSLQCVDGKSPELDSLFSQQASRLQAQIDKSEQNQ